MRERGLFCPFSSLFLPGALVVLLAGTTLSPEVYAQNPVFQNFFFDVCGGSPTGALATRCAETPAGTGNLSGDSEDSLNPSQFLDVNRNALDRARLVNKQIQERMEKKRANPDAAQPPRWGVFGHLNFESLERDETTLQRGFEADRSGFDLGYDVRTSDRGLFGLLLSYAQTDSDFDADQPGVNFDPPDSDGSTDADGLSFILYTSRDFGKSAWLDGTLGYGRTEYDFTRNAVFQESTRTLAQTDVGAEADSESEDLSVGFGLGHDHGRGAYGGSFYGRLNYIRTEVDPFTERDPSGLAMEVREEDRSSFLGTLGWRGSRTFSTSWGVVIPHVRIEYEPEFEDDPQTANARYGLDAAQNIFRLEGDSEDTDYFNGATGVSFVMPRGWNAFLDLEVLMGHSFLDRRRVTVGLRKEL